MSKFYEKDHTKHDFEVSGLTIIGKNTYTKYSCKKCNYFLNLGAYYFNKLHELNDLSTNCCEGSK